MQLGAVLDLQPAGGVADRRERALRDLHGLGAGVDEVQPVEELAPGERAFEHIELEPEILAAAVLGRAHLAPDDLDDIFADGKELEPGGGVDGGGIEGGAEMGHGEVS